MSNTWEYATLGTRQRLKLIRSGDENVYNSEKKRNNELKKLQKELGLSTKSVDDWDDAIDKAYSSSKENASSKRSVTQSQSPAIREANEYMSNLKADADKKAEDAKLDAEKALKYLEEWLVNNGYSEEGSFSKQSKDMVEKKLALTLKEINRQYQEKAKKESEKILKAFFGM